MNRNLLRVNDTRNHYRFGTVDLMTEFTICESFATIDSPYMTAVDHHRSYGVMVGERLGLQPGSRICEVGGGYGSLMRGLLEEYAGQIGHVYMIDLSRALLKRQRERLQAWSPLITFINGDIAELAPTLSDIDCLIVNEVIGDLETLQDLDCTNLPADVWDMVQRYDLDLPLAGTVHFNWGAISLVEEICRRGIPVFLAEHASDPSIPDDMAFLRRGLNGSGYPREIRLAGHSEFTIRFSHLIKVARAWGRRIDSGSLIDLVGIRRSPQMRFVFMARAQATDEQALLYELLDHIREYRWLFIHGCREGR